MADIVLLFVLKGRDCMSKVLIEVLIIVLAAVFVLMLYSAIRIADLSDQRMREIYINEMHKKRQDETDEKRN